MEQTYNEQYDVCRSQKYCIKEKIGEGAFGEVRLGIDTMVGSAVAMKYVRMGSGRGSMGIPRAVFREIEALKQLKSLYIVELTDIFPLETNIILVFEYMALDLASVIAHRSALLPSKAVKYISQAILKGVSHCHSFNVIHRDIKPSNILLNDKGEVKIADFGLARILDTREGAASMSHQIATRWYRPPELLFGARHYSAAVDMWAVGTVIAELMTFLTLFPGSNDIDQIFKVFQILGTPTPESWPNVEKLPDYNKVSFPTMAPLTRAACMPTVPQEERDFVFNFVCLDPATRLTAAQALCHPYLVDASLSHPCATEVMQLKSCVKNSRNPNMKIKGKEDVEELILSSLCSEK